MSVEQIKEIIIHGEKEKQLADYQRELENKISELQVCLSRLKLMQTDSSQYEVTVKELDEQLVFSKTASVENNKQLYGRCRIIPVAIRFLPLVVASSPAWSL